MGLALSGLVEGAIDFRVADAVLDQFLDHLLSRWSFGGASGQNHRSIFRSPTVTSAWHIFNYVVFGTVVFTTYARIYFWFPKMTGRVMDEWLGKWHF